MASGNLRFVKNALSNVVNGTSSAVFAIILPYFFVRYFSRAEFGLWVLVLQLAAYVNYLNFGFQVAIGRYVTYSLERGDHRHAEDILTAGLQTLSALGALGFVLIAILAWLFPHIFAQVDPRMVPEARAALLWIGGAVALGLPSSAFMGVFVGLQRNEIPAGVTAFGKFLLGVAVVVAVARTRDLVVVAQVYFAGSLLQYLLQYFVFIYMCPGWHVRAFTWHRAVAMELIAYCAGLSIWTFAMLLINGLDTVIVGIFDFRAVAPYGTALSIVTFFVGTLQALSSPLIQTFARRHARDERGEILRELEIASFICSMLLFVGGAFVVSIAGWFFVAWVGPAIAKAAIPVFLILMVANALRYTASPYAHFIVSTGQQKKMTASALLEGTINCLASIALASRLGAPGVAIGTLIGVICALSMNFFYNMSRTLPPGFSRARLFRHMIADPLLYAAPAILIVILQYLLRLPALLCFGLIVIASIPAVLKCVRIVTGNGVLFDANVRAMHTAQTGGSTKP